jgi:hypothetical protein
MPRIEPGFNLDTDGFVEEFVPAAFADDVLEASWAAKIPRRMLVIINRVIRKGFFFVKCFNKFVSFQPFLELR